LIKKGMQALSMGKDSLFKAWVKRKTHTSLLSMKELRRNLKVGGPLGDESFIKQTAVTTGRSLFSQKAGRPNSRRVLFVWIE
jgi:hypothetical protein